MGGFLSTIINFFTDDSGPVLPTTRPQHLPATRPQHLPATRPQYLPATRPQHLPATKPTSWAIGESRHNDERQFFQLFFSGMNQVLGYQGILQRWETEVQRVQNTNGDRYKMKNVWLDRRGYVETLQRVQKFVSGRQFSSKLSQLSKLANDVVCRREGQFNAAKRDNRADPQHLIVLEKWRAVRNSLYNLL